jgi:hypothetical protein
VNLSQFAPFTVDGPVLMSCDRCGQGEVFGPAGPDVALTDLVAWARDHRCPAAATPAPGRVLAIA